MSAVGARHDLDDVRVYHPAVADPKVIASTGKVPSDLHVLPPTAVAWCVEALRNGAIDKGYGVRNWRDEGKDRLQLTTYLDAIGRHLMQLQEGEDVAQDSFVSHLAHIMATCAILLDARACGRLEDNRVWGSVVAFEKTQDEIREGRRLRDVVC